MAYWATEKENSQKINYGSETLKLIMRYNSIVHGWSHTAIDIEQAIEAGGTKEKREEKNIDSQRDVY